MGVDLLVIRKNESSSSGSFDAQSGLRLMTECSENLREQAETLGVKPLDDFFDPARAEFQFYEEWHGEEAPEGWLEEHGQWFSPCEAIKTLQALIHYFKESGQTEIVPKVESLECLMNNRGGLNSLTGETLDFYTPAFIPPSIAVESLLGELDECLKILREIENEHDLFCFEVSV